MMNDSGKRKITLTALLLRRSSMRPDSVKEKGADLS